MLRAGTRYWNGLPGKGVLLGQLVFSASGCVDWVLFAELRTQPLLGIRLVAALLLVGTACGALLGGWLALSIRASGRLKAASDRRWAPALLGSLPVAVFGMWVPSSWIAEHWDSLTSAYRVLAIAVYPVVPVAAAAGGVVVAWTARQYDASPNVLPVLHWPTTAALVFAAIGLRWADATILPGLYHDLHVGLAGGFALAVAAVLALLRATLLRRRAVFARLARPSARVLMGLVGVAVVVLTVGALAAPVPRGIHRAAASSTFVELGWSLASLSFASGVGCTPVVTSGKAALDIPGNGLDEDCTGADLSWPPPLTPFPAPRQPKRHNIVMITVEAMRADHLSAYGYARKTSPSIEGLARGGWRFEHAHSPDSKTWNSLPSLHAGVYPSNLPRDYARPRKKWRKAKDYLYYATREVPFLAEYLVELGYRSYAASPLRLVRTVGLDRGFDRLDVSGGITRKARDFINRTQQPFFVWLHYTEPHSPYTRRKRFDFGEREIDRYDAEIAETDRQIGAILRTLRQRKLDNKTIVIVTADHGEEFGEHGGRYHESKLYRELTHVPLVIKVPGTHPAVVESPVDLADVVPTLRDLVGFRADPSEFDGRSLLDAVAGRRPPHDVGAYSENYRRGAGLIRRALVTANWHLIQNLETLRVELYHVGSDPLEQTDVAPGNENIWKPLLEKLGARSLRRPGRVFDVYQESGDARVLARGLPKLQQDHLLRLAIEHLSKAPRSKEIRKAIRDLLARPGLSDESRRRAEALLAGG